MEVKPGYKQTEVGVIPEEWEVKLLPEVLRFRGGKAHEQHISETGRYICVNSKFISTDGGVRKYSSANFCPANKGDVLIVMSDLPNGRALAKAYLVDEDDTYAVNQRVCALTAYRDCPEYFFYVLNRHPYFLKFDNGVSQTHLLNSVFQKCPIPVPPRVDEQRAIAAALSEVDGLLGGLDRLIAKKRDLKQAAMQQLLTGQTRLPGFHGEWEVKRLGDVNHLIRGGIYGDEKPRAGLSASSVATTAHIEMDDTWNNKEMPVRYFTAEKLRDYSTVEGDLIVVKSSGSAASIQSGKLGFIDSERAGKFVFSNFLMLLRPTGVSPRFLYFYLCSHNVKKLLPTLVEASTYPNIRLGDYLDVEIPVPPQAEQTAIATVLSEMDGELAVLEQRREKTRALKQAMMQELLTGRTRLI